MADDLLAVSAVSVATTGRQALNRTAAAATTGTVLQPSSAGVLRPGGSLLTSGATATSDGRAPADVTVDEARTMIRSALLAADRILGALGALAQSVGLAAESSLTATTLGVQPNGTRLSGLNIQAAAGRVIEAIDDLVDGIGLNGVNLLFGDSRPLRVQTTRFGGQLTISPQPLDSRSLGIASLATIDRDDAQAALAAIQNAQVAVVNRIGTLESIERALDFGGVVEREVSRAIAGGDGLSTRGALVDLSI